MFNRVILFSQISGTSFRDRWEQWLELDSGHLARAKSDFLTQLKHGWQREYLLFHSILDGETLRSCKPRVLSPVLAARLKAAIEETSFPADILSDSSHSQAALQWIPDLTLCRNGE